MEGKRRRNKKGREYEEVKEVNSFLYFHAERVVSVERGLRARGSGFGLWAWRVWVRFSFLRIWPTFYVCFRACVCVFCVYLHVWVNKNILIRTCLLECVCVYVSARYYVWYGEMHDGRWVDGLMGRRDYRKMEAVGEIERRKRVGEGRKRNSGG